MSNAGIAYYVFIYKNLILIINLCFFGLSLITHYLIIYQIINHKLSAPKARLSISL